MRRIDNKQHGFTLMEIIAVLVVLGIMATVVVSRSVNYDVEVQTGADALKTHLRYAQTLAMNANPNTGTQTIFGINYDSGANQYWLFQGVNTTQAILLPDDTQFSTADRKIDLGKKKIRFSGVFPVYFDNRGVPYAAYTSSTVNTPLSGGRTITVQAISGTAVVNVTINELTGFIP